MLITGTMIFFAVSDSITHVWIICCFDFSGIALSCCDGVCTGVTLDR